MQSITLGIPAFSFSCLVISYFKINITFHIGDVLLKQGEEGEKFTIILEGGVSIVREKET